MYFLNNNLIMKTIFILNHPPYYRKSIFKLLEANLDCEFAFGFLKKGNIKSLNKTDFNNSFISLKTINFFFNLYYIFGSLRLSLKNKYDNIVLTGEFKSINTWVILIVNFFNSKKKVYLWTHGYYGSENLFKRIIKKIYFFLSDGIFLYGQYSKKLMVKNKIVKEKKMHVIYNSLNFNLQNRYYNKLTKTKQENPFFKYFKNNNPNLIFIGRLTKAKNLDLIFSAQKKCINKNKPFNVFIIGEGNESDVLAKIVSDNNLNDFVKFFGASYDEKVISNYLYFADVCVSPGNVGLTAIHSLTYSTPVLTHDNFSKQMPEFEVIKENENGYFFKYNDVDDLSKTIIKCISLSKSKNKNLFRKPILEHYNPKYQIKIFKSVLAQA